MKHEAKRLYCKLMRPVNEYDGGRVVFESSINRSVNFRIFCIRDEFRRFRDSVYVEVCLDMSADRKWLVERLRLMVRTRPGDDSSAAFDAAVRSATGHSCADFAAMNPVDAWAALETLAGSRLPYAKALTDRQYTPAAAHDTPEFFALHPDERTVALGTRRHGGDNLFEISVDADGRAVFSYLTDTSGYPAALECLLDDIRVLLDAHGTSGRAALLDDIAGSLPD